MRGQGGLHVGRAPFLYERNARQGVNERGQPNCSKLWEEESGKRYINRYMYIYIYMH